MASSSVRQKLRRRSESTLFPPIKGPLASSPSRKISEKNRGTVSEFLVLPSIQDNDSNDTDTSIGRFTERATFDPEDDYDYDQDEDVVKSFWTNVPRNLKQSDLIKGYYKRACEKEHVLPLSRFSDQIGNSSIIIKDIGISTKAFKAICACALHMPDIISLNLSGNSLGKSEMSYLTQLMKENNAITTLILADNNINGQAVEILANYITSKKCKRFLKLDLSGNGITDDDGQNIAKILQNKDIQELYLGRNQLRENGPIYLARALGENDNLEVLDLSWNHIRGAGAVALSNSIARNTNLRTLNISWNGFGYDGSLAMGHALVHNSTLTKLDLSNNRVHPPALFNFMDNMLKNDTLMELKLAYNPIPVCFTSPLLTLLLRKKECPLEVLDLSGVIVDTLFETLLEDLQAERDITVLYDRCLPIHKEKWSKMLTNIENEDVKVLNIDPVRILFLLKQNLRCIDMLFHMDKDHSYDLSRSEIKEALDRHDLPVSSSALDKIMEYLDTNKDGHVDLSELIEGERRLNRDDLTRADAERKKGALSVDTSQFSKTFKGDTVNGLQSAVIETLQRASTLEKSSETKQ